MLVARQMGGRVDDGTDIQLESQEGVPKVPTAPKDVEQFGEQMDQFMKDEAAKRAAEIESSTAQ